MCLPNKHAYLWLDGRLTVIDKCMGYLILQLNLAGIKTRQCCCGHGRGYPHVLCETGTEEKLKEFGCKIITTRADALVAAYFPCSRYTGKVNEVDSS